MYRTILTKIGRSKIGNFVLTQQPVLLKHFAVGDSQGTPYTPTEDQTALKNEKYRVEISKAEVLSQGDINKVSVEAILASSVGGFLINEVGLFDEVGDLIAIARQPERFKPLTDDGTTSEMKFIVEFYIANASSVQVKVDPSIIVITQENLNQHNSDQHAHEDIRNRIKGHIQDRDNPHGLTAAQIGAASEVHDHDDLYLPKTEMDAFRNAYTEERAINLDKLDVNVSSRAPANTALSNGIWTNARAAAIDTIHANAARLTAARASIIDNIGATNNTGGSTTAGTVMAKLNALLTWFTGTWTAARAAKLDTIATKVGQGDYFGKQLKVENLYKTGEHRFSHAKGGIAILSIRDIYVRSLKLEIDGVVVIDYISPSDLFVFFAEQGGNTFHPLIIPFDSSFKLTITSDKPAKIIIKYYLNK